MDKTPLVLPRYIYPYTHLYRILAHVYNNILHRCYINKIGTTTMIMIIIIIIDEQGERLRIELDASYGHVLSMFEIMHIR